MSPQLILVPLNTPSGSFGANLSPVAVDEICLLQLLSNCYSSDIKMIKLSFPARAAHGCYEL